MNNPKVKWLSPRVGAAAAMILMALVTAFVAADALSTRAGGVQDDPGALRPVPLQKMDEALARGDVRAAERAWHIAYLEALGNRGWEELLHAGDASLRIGEAAGHRAAAEARARRLYLAALFRARAQGSLDGVLRVAEAFAMLGDGEVVERAARIAEDLAAQAGEPRARERVRVVGARLSDPLAAP